MVVATGTAPLDGDGTESIQGSSLDHDCTHLVSSSDLDDWVYGFRGWEDSEERNNTEEVLLRVEDRVEDTDLLDVEERNSWIADSWKHFSGRSLELHCPSDREAVHRAIDDTIVSWMRLRPCDQHQQWQERDFQHLSRHYLGRAETDGPRRPPSCSR